MSELDTMPQVARAVELPIIQRLRADVWRDIEQDARAFASIIDDGHDDHATHLVVRTSSGVVGASRVCVHRDLAHVPLASCFLLAGFSPAPPIASLNRVVVAPSHSGWGHANALERAALDVASSLGARSIVTVIKPDRVQAYERFGFKVFGPARLEQWPHLSEGERLVLWRSL